MRTPLTNEELLRHLKNVELIKIGFDLLSDHVVITDENANILYANKAVEQNTGFSVEECMGKNPADLWGGKMPEEFYSKMWHTIKEEKKPFVGEIKNIRKDGTEYWQELHISPVLDHNGHIEFFIGIEPDITERRKREKFSKEFISAVGHQLRNPLTAVQWVIEGLLSHSSLKEEDKAHIASIYKENQNLARLVNDLLLLARMDRPSLQLETIHLDEELRLCAESVRQKQPDISFSFRNEAGAVLLETVKSLALRVFLNIMHNAAEHTERKQGVVTIALQRQMEKITFSCHNSGPAIPIDIQPQIFSKLPSSTGEGLGLFLAKTICDYFGWAISFETNDGGTTFFVMIPTSSSS